MIKRPSLVPEIIKRGQLSQNLKKVIEINREGPPANTKAASECSIETRLLASTLAGIGNLRIGVLSVNKTSRFCNWCLRSCVNKHGNSWISPLDRSTRLHVRYEPLFFYLQFSGLACVFIIRQNRSTSHVRDFSSVKWQVRDRSIQRTSYNAKPG